ncbi:MAG: AAA family ATPase [Patescibacteria group bacterium]|nr:AAA family ATPase [Patescibacteria group bacterium]
MTKGLLFKKFVLHLHTPGSSDWKGGNKAAEDIVKKAIEKELAAIAVTDHNSGDFVDEMKKAAEKTSLVVFPGAEIVATGGKKGIHLIVIFDVDKNSAHVKAFLNTIGIYKKTAAADKTVNEIARKLEEFDPSAIIILAHCHSSKGVSGDMQGEVRANIFNQKNDCILAAEAARSDFEATEKIEKHTRVIDLLDGSNPNFGKKKLAVIQAADSHDLDSVGDKFTYLKVDEVITIEDLRQAFIDRETRVRQPWEYTESQFPKILRVKVKSGFLDGEEVEFNDGLNSIIGSKGSGKSLLVELLRFALSQESHIKAVSEDHFSKLENCLKLHGVVTVTFSDKTGHLYELERTYAPSSESPTRITDLEDGSIKSFDVETLFPILFLSQNEAIRIAEENGGENQRRFIDRFFDFHKYQSEIKRLNKRLAEIDTRFADAIESKFKLGVVQKELATLEEEVAKLDRQMKKDIFAEYSEKEKINISIRSKLDFFDSLESGLESIIIDYRDIQENSTATDGPDDPIIKRSNEILQGTTNSIVEGLSGIKDLIGAEKKKFKAEVDDWDKKFKSIKNSYHDAVLEAGGSQVVLNEQREGVLARIKERKKEEAFLKSKTVLLNSLADERKSLLRGLEETRKAYYDQRKERCKYLSEKSSGLVKVSIKEMEDKSVFKQKLLALKKGSWISDKDMEIMAEKIKPKDLVSSLINYANGTREKSVKKVILATDIDEKTVEKLFDFLTGSLDVREILALMYDSVPEDVPVIKYKVGTGEYRELKDLSTGQKASALLIVALTDGDFPIIIDQPEDSLDLVSIWNDVCENIRKTKEKRQFIFTTHNSSVAVASDSDNYIILEADATTCRVVVSGSNNSTEVNDKIVSYLEGGKPTYALKRRKYINKRK